MIKITPRRWEQFEFYYTVYLNHVDNWRYGYAFLFFFGQELLTIDLEHADRQTLFFTESESEAQTIINKYIEIIEEQQ